MNTRSKRKVWREEVRREILAAALEVFSERGFHRAKMTEIAERAGVAVGTLYQYFPSKKALYETLLFEAASRIHERIIKVLSREGPPQEILMKFLEVKLETLRENETLLKLHLRELWEARFRGVHTEKIRALFEDYLERLAGILKKLPSPLSKNPRFYAALVDGVMATAVVEAVEGRIPFPGPKDLWEVLSQALIPGERAHE